MNLQNIFLLFGIFFLFRFKKVTSILTANDGYCGYSEIEEDLCASYCYKSVKPPLMYIIKLKDQIKASALEYSDAEKDIKNIEKRFLEKNVNLEMLRKTNDDLDKTNDILTEEIAQQKKHIENIEININQRSEIENMKDKIKDLKSKIASYKQKLEKSQDDLRDKNLLVESYSLNFNQIETDLTKCTKIIDTMSKSSCENLPSGIQIISIAGIDPFPALCNGNISDGGWMIIYKRSNLGISFDRSWTDYRNGFGELDKDFFIGLENLHHITKSQTHELYILEGYEPGTYMSSIYDNFRIGSEEKEYELESLGEHIGETLDNMKNSLHMKFSTFDHGAKCEDFNIGAWWDGCYGSFYQFDSIQMLIRPKSNIEL